MSHKIRSMETPTRYVAADSYDRGHASYQKTLSRWKSVQFMGQMTIILGVAIGGFPFTVVSGLDTSVLIKIALIGAGVTVIGAIPALLAKNILHRYKLEDFIHQLALHYMREMGIQNPHVVLDQNPRYLEAFEEVRSAVTEMEAANNGIRVSSQSLTPLSRRIGSLVLRDDRSLELAPHLLSLIESRNLLDYEALAVLLDSKGEHHSTMTDGLL